MSKKGKTVIKVLSEDALRKKYKDAGRADIILPDSDKFIFLPSRCLALNWQLGGGIPYGRIMEVFGYESTGKSLIATDFGTVAQSLGGVVLWGDAEGTFTKHWAQQNGLDLSKLELYNSNDIEGFSDWARDMILFYRSKLTKNQPILLVLDSIAATDTKVNSNATQTDRKAEMGNRAKEIYAFLRYRNSFFKHLGICVILINQVRSKLGASMFESNETTPGGNSIRFYSSLRLAVQGSKQIKGKKVNGIFVQRDDGKKVGKNVSFQIVKNKVAPPKNSVKSQVYFTDAVTGYVGFSRYWFLADVLEMDGVIKKKGKAGYYFKDKFIARGEESFMKEFGENEKMRKFLLKKSTINTTSKTREKLTSLHENLFPVKLKELDDEE